MDRVTRITGLLVGTAVGDSLGLPREGLGRRRAARIYGGPLRQRWLLGRGMLSDDTEHACMTAQALLAAGEDDDDGARFARSLAWKLRWWLAALPPAIGFGTLRSLVRAWLGISPSGVRSAGNGAAMRAPIIGAWCDDPDRIAPLVAASTAITHRDPRALAGATAIAIAAHHAMSPRLAPAAVLADIHARVAEPELLGALDRVARALDDRSEPAALADQLGLARGVTGYVNHTVPICLHAWLRAPADIRGALERVVALGGDTDTTGAIVGALAGACAGEAGIPREWLAIADAPRSLAWIRRLAARVAERGRPLPLAWPIVPLRNIAFLAIAVAHAARRALPPY